MKCINNETDIIIEGEYYSDSFQYMQIKAVSALSCEQLGIDQDCKTN